jgi:hypothetical protein
LKNGEALHREINHSNENEDEEDDNEAFIDDDDLNL